MADFDFQEAKMLTRWYGIPDLVHNEAFWDDCLKNYAGKVVTLPYDDTPEQRREVASMLRCPPGECGSCCRRSRIPIMPEEGEVLSTNSRQDLNIEADSAGNASLITAGGCQFLKNNACAIYKDRPVYCRDFPVIEPRKTASEDGTIFSQLQVELGCKPALEIIRTLMARACAGGQLMLLPDLSIIPTYENAALIFEGENEEEQGVY